MFNTGPLELAIRTIGTPAGSSEEFEMNIMTKVLSAVSLSVVMTFTSFASANAMPLPSVKAPQISKVEDVQYRRYRDRDPRWSRDRRPGWHGGYRGYRDRRPGYRRHSDGWWYPLAAFTAGAIIGGAINNSRPAYAGSSRHIRWCADRYRTYRASDNTYVPRAGVRAQCVSPYR